MSGLFPLASRPTPRIGYGLGALVRAVESGRITRDEGVHLLHTAFDLGELSESAAQRPHELREAVEANLASLGTDRLDLVHLRRVDRGPGLVAEGDQEPYFPLGGGAYAGLPKVVDDPVVRELATALGATPSQVGLAWHLAHAPNTFLIPGTASEDHMRENLAAGDITLDDDAMAALDAAASRRLCEPGDRSAPQV